MDPLSIAAGSAGLATSCFKIVSILYTFIDETRSVDENVAALIAEVRGLSQVLETVSKSLKHDALVGLRSSDNVNLWTMVEGSLQECGITLDKLQTMLQDLNGTANSRFGVLRRPIMQVRLNMKLKEIGDFQQQVHSHYSGMQLTLGTINVNSSQQDLSRQLTDLKDQITLANTLALQQQTAQPGLSVDTLQDSRRISNHLKNLARDAESLRSSASTAIEGDRSTIWGGSVLGDQLSNDQYRDIRNWIPPPIEEESLEGKSIGSGPISDDHTARADSDSDSESDPEQELVEMFEKRGLQKLADKEYEQAEKFLCKAISLRKPSSKTTTSLEHIKANLADCYCQQAKWEDADRLLSELSDSRNKLDILALHSLHAVSHVYFGKANLDAADRTCRKSLLGKKKLLGKTHESYYLTLLLLACICDAKGDEVQGDGWRHFLPASLESRTRPVPLDHQLRPKTFTPSHLHESLQSPAVQPIPETAASDEGDKQSLESGLETQSAPAIMDEAIGASSLSIRRKPLHLSTLDDQEAPTSGSDVLATDSQTADLKSLMPYFFDSSVENNAQAEIVKPLHDEQLAKPALDSSEKIGDGSPSKPAVKSRDGGWWAKMLEPSTRTSSSDDKHEPEAHPKPAPETFTSPHASPPSSIILPSLTPPMPRSSTHKVCGKCAQSLSGRFVRALGDMYHLECFTCKDCGTIVASKFFTLQDGQIELPLCETDYFRRLDLLCAGCGLACRGSYITALEKKYHTECFKCQTQGCNRVFGAADNYYEHEDGVYCREHYSEHYALRSSTILVNADTLPVTVSSHNVPLDPSLAGPQVYDPDAAPNKTIREYLTKRSSTFVRLEAARKKGWADPEGDKYWQKRHEQADKATGRDPENEQAEVFYEMTKQIAREMQDKTEAMTPGHLGAETFQSLDLCMAPGGFTWGANEYNIGGAVAYGITLASEEGGHRNFYVNAAVKFMDITMLASEAGIDDIPKTHPDHSLFITERPFLDQQYQLVFCGGAVLRTHQRSEHRRDFERSRLTTSQLILAMQRILPGGTMVVLLRRPDAWDVVHLLHQFDSFAEIQLFKPAKKHAVRSTFYLVAKNVQPESETAKAALKEWKQSWIRSTFGGESGTGEKDPETGVEDVQKVLDEFGTKLIELATHVWKTQADALVKQDFKKSPKDKRKKQFHWPQRR
ncbi:hypothetical protein EG327_011384 [Venturia inaequalis]|uniref:LIM zinc-binding domain-containing protein n=1 Tax=Venturia inaequalis TaxID=5025 RepID=A0A8H3YSA9_VENIN|nr:hypothetical protein EG327_011384 [Venturia inaequalis]